MERSSPRRSAAGSRRDAIDPEQGGRERMSRGHVRGKKNQPFFPGTVGERNSIVGSLGLGSLGLFCVVGAVLSVEERQAHRYLVRR